MTDTVVAKAIRNHLNGLIGRSRTARDLLRSVTMASTL